MPNGFFCIYCDNSWPMEKISREMTVRDVLVCSHLMTSISEVGDKFFKSVSYGSGFFVNYKKQLYFVTADHTLHFDDYGADQERTWKDYQLSIFNNVDGQDLSTILTPVGGFYFMEKFDLRKLSIGLKGKPIDITACVMDEDKLKHPFLTQKFKYDNGDSFQLPVVVFGEEILANPQKDKKCLVFGQVHTRVKGIQLLYDNVTYELDYDSTHGDFHIFHASDIVTHRDWGGLSGTPVVDEDGECVAILTSINEGTKTVWGISTARLKMLLDVIDRQKSMNLGKRI